MVQVIRFVFIGVENILGKGESAGYRTVWKKVNSHSVSLKGFKNLFFNRIFLSHNNHCVPCNIAIMNFLVSNMCEIRFNDVIDHTVRMFIS